MASSPNIFSIEIDLFFNILLLTIKSELIELSSGITKLSQRLLSSFLSLELEIITLVVIEFGHSSPISDTFVYNTGKVEYTFDF